MADDLDLARKKMAAGIEKAEKPAPEPEPAESEASETINIDDDDDEVAPVASGPSRGEKKANRFSEANERAAQAERETANLRAELAAERVAARQQPQSYQQQPQVDRFAAERAAVEREQEELTRNFAARQSQGQMSQEEHGRFVAKQHEITRRGMRIEIQAESAAQPQIDPRVQHFHATSQDVQTHPVARKWAKGAYEQRLAEIESQYGSVTPQQDMDAAMESADAARKKYKLGSYRGGTASSERQQARYAGPSRSAPQSASTSSESRQVTITPEMRKTIDADPRYNKLPASERYKAWAKKVGPTFLKMRVDTDRQG